MISKENIAQEFIEVIERVYPKTGELLQRCYIKAIDFYPKRLKRHFYYIAVYCPEYLIPELQGEKDCLKDIAENMGLIEVSLINATRLVRDPMSKLRQVDPRFWLELQWIATQAP